MCLVKELVLNFSAVIKCAKAQFNPIILSGVIEYTRKEIEWLIVLRFVRRTTILESKPELLEKVVRKSHHNGEVYYVNLYSLSVAKMETLRQIFTIYDGYVSLPIILIFRLQ